MNRLLNKLTEAYTERDIREVLRVAEGIYNLGLLDGTDTEDSVMDDMIDEERANLMGTF